MNIIMDRINKLVREHGIRATFEDQFRVLIEDARIENGDVTVYVPSLNKRVNILNMTFTAGKEGDGDDVVF